MTQKQCAQCPTIFEAKRPQAKFCSAKCRVRANRGMPPQRGVPATSPQVKEGNHSGDDLVEAVRAELSAAGRETTALGVQALRIATWLGQYETGSSRAALSKELRSVMAEALRNAESAADPLDELKARRDRKRAAS